MKILEIYRISLLWDGKWSFKFIHRIDTFANFVMNKQKVSYRAYVYDIEIFVFANQFFLILYYSAFHASQTKVSLVQLYNIDSAIYLCCPEICSIERHVIIRNTNNFIHIYLNHLCNKMLLIGTILNLYDIIKIEGLGSGIL